MKDAFTQTRPANLATPMNGRGNLRPHSRNESAFVLGITMGLVLLSGISIAAFLSMIKTQLTQVRQQSRFTKAFYAAEVGLEKGIELLKNDLYYTPEGMEPSWADDNVYNSTGYIHLQVQKYMNPQSANYHDDFYPLVAETDYESEGNGAHKSTYQIDLANLVGWTDRIWVKATGKYYEKDTNTGTYTLKAERRILSLLRAREINPWDNAIFAGEGAAGRVINGNVDIRGSVHVLGTSLGSNDWAMEFSGSGNVGNNYVGMPAVLASRVPSIAKTYGEDVVESLEAEVRVQRGKVALSGSSCLGMPNVPENSVKETVEGVYITDGYAGNQGDTNVHSDNGASCAYDLDGFEVEFPRLSQPYGGSPTYLDWLRANAFVISEGEQLSQMGSIKPTSVFSYGDEKGGISMDGNGNMNIRGIVVVEGDIKFDSDQNFDTIEYEGKGSLASAHNAFVKCNLITGSFSTYPKATLLGLMAADRIEFDCAQLNVMGVFYAENEIKSKKQTSVAGTFVSDYFDMGSQVPAIYYVPEVSRNLPPGMIGPPDTRFWVVKKMTWGEIGPRKTVQEVEE